MAISSMSRGSDREDAMLLFVLYTYPAENRLWTTEPDRRCYRFDRLVSRLLYPQSLGHLEVVPQRTADLSESETSGLLLQNQEVQM